MLLVTPARVSHARGDSQSSGSVLSDNSINKSHSIIRPEAAPDYLVATEYPGGRVLIEWHTGAAIDNLGFNIYREAKGSWDRITPQIIIGATLRTRFLSASERRQRELFRRGNRPGSCRSSSRLVSFGPELTQRGDDRSSLTGRNAGFAQSVR